MNRTSHDPIRQHGSALWRAVAIGVRGQELRLAVSTVRLSCDAPVVHRHQLEVLLAHPSAREERVSDVAPRAGPSALGADEAEEQRRYFLLGKTGS